jgi:hypothetical protein
MKADPPIDEIRAIRHEISAEFGHDPKRYIQYLRDLEKEYPEQIRRYHELQRTTHPSVARESGPTKPDQPKP